MPAYYRTLAGLVLALLESLAGLDAGPAHHFLWVVLGSCFSFGYFLVMTHLQHTPIPIVSNRPPVVCQLACPVYQSTILDKAGVCLPDGGPVSVTASDRIDTRFCVVAAVIAMDTM